MDKDSSKTKEELLKELDSLREEFDTYKVLSEKEKKEYKLAQEKIQISDLSYKNILNYISEALYVQDENGLFIYVNKAVEDLYGYPNSYFIGKTPEFLSAPGMNNLTEIARKIKSAFNGNPQRFEFWGIKKNGAIFPKEVSITQGEYLAKKVVIAVARDISESKQVNSLLQETTERLTFLIEAIPDTIFLKDGEGRWLITNEPAKQLFKLHDFDWVGKTDAQLGDERPDLKSAHKSCILSDEIAWNAGTLVTNDEYITDDKGIVQQYEVRKMPLFNPDGKRKALVIIGTDVTIKQETIRKLSDSETQYRNLLSQLPDIVLIHKNGIILYANQSASEATEYSMDELIGSNVLNYVVEEQRDIVIHNTTRRESGEFVGDYELDMKTKRGTLKKAIVRTTSTKFNGEEAIIIILIDITMFKRVEQDLVLAKEKAESSEERFRSLIENASDGVVIVNGELDKIIYSSPNAHRHFGYSENEILGHSGAEFTHPDDMPIVFEAFKTIVTNPMQKPTVTYRFKGKNGEYRWIATTFANLLNNKAINGFVLNFSDITEKKLVTDALVAAKEKAEESNRLKSAFLANMSHEIRTPMNGILGFTSLLKEPKLTGEEQKEYIDFIEKSGARMLNIISDIVDISKIESGTMDIRISDTDINKQLEFVNKIIEHDAVSKKLNISFNSSLPDKEAIIKTDSSKFNSILTNLLTNAIKYTEKGSIVFGYLKKDEYLEFYIKDTGIGIPQDRQEAVFERFIQADIEDKMARQGAGLGLSITKAYVEMLHGKIWLESEVGKGSTFYFTLPYNTVPEEKKVVGKVVPEVNEKNQINPEVPELKIVIAEDDETSEMLISINIKEFSKEIIKVRTGSEAVEICRNNPDIDLILMDIQMPGLNGYEATHQIRQFNKGVVIIAQTAFGLSGDREKAIEAGCNDYISKPINKNELLSLIQKYFKK